MKHIKIIIFLFILFRLFRPGLVSANFPNNVVLYINQVRGIECCQEGSIDALEKQIISFSDFNQRAAFVVRYDVLSNEDFLSVLKQLNSEQFEIGAFLEITPQLAADSGVTYTGTEKNWSEAHNAYTLGYSLEDRIKILDTYMNKFYSVFGYYQN